MTNHITWQTVDETAAKLGASRDARLKWRQVGRGVPPVWQIKIMRELMSSGIVVSLDDFAKLPVTPGRAA